MDELKPCPFCGEEAKMILQTEHYEEIHVFAECSNCGAQSKKLTVLTYWEDQEKELSAAKYAAKRRWNRRFSDGTAK